MTPMIINFNPRPSNYLMSPSKLINSAFIVLINLLFLIKFQNKNKSPRRLSVVRDFTHTQRLEINPKLVYSTYFVCNCALCTNVVHNDKINAEDMITI